MCREPFAKKATDSASDHATRDQASGVRLGCLLLAAAVVPPLRNLCFDARYARDDHRQIAADMTTQAQSGDAVLLNAPNQWEVFTYYSHTPTGERLAVTVNGEPAGDRRILGPVLISR